MSCRYGGVSTGMAQPSGTVKVTAGWNAVDVYVPAGMAVAVGPPAAGEAEDPPQAVTARRRARDARPRITLGDLLQEWTPAPAARGGWSDAGLL